MATATKARPRGGGRRNGTPDGENKLVRFLLSEINPSPENDRLYRPVNKDDPEIRSLADSICEHGLREPLTISGDGFIISGHRRYAACKLAGLTDILCQVDPIRRADDVDRFTVLLREHNRQRDKNLAEKLREEIVNTDPDDAHACLTEFRRSQSKVKLNALPIRGVKVRSEITDAKQPMLDAILAVIESRRDYLPLTVRTIHYALLNDPPLIHATKPASVYKNDRKSYDRLDELLTRARLKGLIDDDVIHDPTRPVTTWRCYPNPRSFIRKQLDGFLNGYARDLMQSQPNHIEVIGEKNTVDSVLATVCGVYCIPLTTGRGYSSLPPRQSLADRYESSGKEKLVLLIVSDFDPDGEEIAHSFARSMRDDFGIEQIHAIKVALTHDQVVARKLPSSLDAKEKSANYARFVAKYGTNAYELEALEPADLQQILREAIDSVIDLDAFNAEVAAEREDARYLKALRRTAVEAIEESLLSPEDEQ